MASKLLYLFLLITFAVICQPFKLIDLGPLPPGYGTIFAGYPIYDGLDSIFYLGGANNGTCDVLEFNVNREHETPRRISSCSFGDAYGDSLGTDGNGSIFFFVVGHPDDRTWETRVYRFSSNYPKVERVGTISRAIQWPAIASDGNGSIYVFGGSQRGSEANDGFYRYNTKNNTVSRVLSLPSRAGYQIKGTWVKGSMVVFKGYGEPAYIFKYTPAEVFGEALYSNKRLETELEISPWRASIFPIDDEIYMPVLRDDESGIDIHIYNTTSEKMNSTEVEGVPPHVYSCQSVYVPKKKRIYFISGMDGPTTRPSGRIGYVQLE